ncbi:MAG: hypothetical protein ABL881_10290 [Novosphingobium sp.]
MGIYEPLARFLGSLKDDSWTASFEQVESKLGFELPPSARKYRQWWSNERGKGHSQKDGWQSVGWETSDVDLRDERVCFVRPRQSNQAMAGRTAGASPSLDELWQRASELSGITDRSELERAAVQTFIRRTAAQGLVELGGTMPDFKAPPRERPFA